MGGQPRIRKSNTNIMTCDEAFTLFINDKMMAGLTATTIKSYKKAYDKIRKDLDWDEKTPITEFNKAAYSAWNVILRASDNSVYTTNHYIGEIKVWMNWCYEEELIDRVWKMAKLPYQDTPPKTFTDDEVNRLLRKPKDMDNFFDVRGWVVASIICATGMRSASLRNLRIRDVDMMNGYIVLSHTKKRNYVKLPISAQLEPILKTWLREWRSKALPDEYVIITMDGRYCEEETFRRLFARYCKSRGVKHTSPHGLRHTFAGNAVKMGIEPFMLKEILGHHSYYSTSRYVKFFGEDFKEGYENYSLLDTSAATKKKTRVKRER